MDQSKGNPDERWKKKRRYSKWGETVEGEGQGNEGTQEGEEQRKVRGRGRRKTEEEEDSRKGRKISGRGSNVHLMDVKR